VNKLIGDMRQTKKRKKKSIQKARENAAFTHKGEKGRGRRGEKAPGHIILSRSSPQQSCFKNWERPGIRGK